MRIYALSVLEVPPNGSATALSSAQDLSSFSFYQRGTVREFLSFFTRTVAERIPQGQRESVVENNYVFHIYNRGGEEQLAAVMVTDAEYPRRPAFSILTKAIDAFSNKVPRSSYATPASIDFRELDEYLVEYQDPKKADTIMRVQAELDETKIIIHKTIESVLERGEKLDDLVARSDALGASSKRFYSTAKKQNSCCIVM
ncbi:snare protein YKT6 [Phellopilus nigrolimitatus]|nr:snare protein YKT6 [Phellopilus nigrolimitatus]